MYFEIYQCEKEPDCFVITDREHEKDIGPDVYPEGGALRKVGEFPEMPEKHAAFDDKMAAAAIRDHGYFIFHARSMDPVAQQPPFMSM